MSDKIAMDATGCISLALYLHAGPTPAAMSTMVEQALTALNSGFDGVTISEHHAGFPGYLPSPLLVTTRILQAAPSGWAGACPILLPLRRTALVVEDLAWLSAMFPHRVVAGVAAGYAHQDFAVIGSDPADANRTLRSQLPEWTFLAHGDASPLYEDPAVRQGLPHVPLVVCTGGPITAREAARNGMGVMLPPQDPLKSDAVIAAFSQEGDSGPRIGTQWVWVGDAPVAGVTALRSAYPTTDSAGNRLYAPDVLQSPNPVEIADTIGRSIARFGLTGINMRIHLPDVGPAETTEQIKIVGRELLPLIRGQFPINPVRRPFRQEEGSHR